MACLCAGGDKSHLYAYAGHNPGGVGGVLSMRGPVWPGPGQQARSGTHHCASLSGGPATLLFNTNHTIEPRMLTLIAMPSNHYRLNYHRVANSTVVSGGGAVWTFGLSGDLWQVPRETRQRAAFYAVPGGPTTAWDEWGAMLRSQAGAPLHKTSSDVFVSALSAFTDNGAATYLPSWPSTQQPPVVPTGAFGAYGPWNWSRVNDRILTSILRQMRATGVYPRGLQLDDWFYPFNRSGGFAMLCGSDWRPPPEYFPHGFADLAAAAPLMLYLPRRVRIRQHLA